MSKARDVVYGRRGGRWAEDDSKAEEAVAWLHQHRLKKIAKGEWPAESLAMWRRIAAEAADHRAAGRPMTDIHYRALEVVEAERRAARR